MKEWKRATRILIYWIVGWTTVAFVLLYVLFKDKF